MRTRPELLTLNKWFACALIAVAAAGCTGGKKRSASLGDFSWLLGTWQLPSERGSVYEVWRQKSDTLFAGASFRVVGRDTVILETMALTANEGGIFLSPKVVGQNNGESVSFALVAQTKTSATFENLKHDFPTRIAYARTSDAVMTAEIRGKVNGKSQSVWFEMRRR